VERRTVKNPCWNTREGGNTREGVEETGKPGVKKKGKKIRKEKLELKWGATRLGRKRKRKKERPRYFFRENGKCWDGDHILLSAREWGRGGGTAEDARVVHNNSTEGGSLFRKKPEGAIQERSGDLLKDDEGPTQGRPTAMRKGGGEGGARGGSFLKVANVESQGTACTKMRAIQPEDIW